MNASYISSDLKMPNIVSVYCDIKKQKILTGPLESEFILKSLSTILWLYVFHVGHEGHRTEAPFYEITNGPIVKPIHDPIHYWQNFLVISGN